MNNYGDYAKIAVNCWNKFCEEANIAHYAGILSMHGLARLAKMQNSSELTEELKAALKPFWTGGVPRAIGVYGENVYRWGGNATAYLVHRGMLDEAKDVVIECCEKLLTKQARDSRGIYHMPSGNRSDKSEGFLWIDTVFGVCPFLLWTGLAADRDDFIDEACFQMIKHHEILFDRENKIYHQAINYNKPGELTPVHWSRGCGWGAFALAEMVFDLPKEHKDYQTILGMYQELIEGCCNFMDEKGMLHQVMEDEDSYPETSGTALVLYAISRGVKNGSLSKEKYLPYLVQGLKGLGRYITVDGSVYNCCKGCLAPNDGTADDYNAVEWILNDDHAFGPIILLYGQAQQLCKIKMIPELDEILFADNEE